MRAPAFWWDEQPSRLARLLAPVGSIYGGITAGRMRRKGIRAPVPVICVGNFTAGGAGKTPVALALGALLKDMGEQPAFLSRGYGGSHRGTPHRVNRGEDLAAVVGDEPLLLAARAPTFVCADRVAGAAACTAAGASVIILDDGLQNPALRKALRIAVVDGRTGLGNGLCIPAGPLRAPIADQWPNVDCVIVIGEGAAGARVANEARHQGKPVFDAVLAPDEAAARRIAGARVLAFAGIGQPSKFYASLRHVGADVVDTRDFPDHHTFSQAELAALRASAAKRGARLVTTEKDLVRIADPAGIEVLPVSLDLADLAAMRDLLAARLVR